MMPKRRFAHVHPAGSTDKFGPGRVDRAAGRREVERQWQVGRGVEHVF
jgi:hypothetical protein